MPHHGCRAWSMDTYIEEISGWESDFLSCLSLVPSFCFFLGSLKGGKIQTSFKPQTGPRVMPCRFAGQCIELLTDLQPIQLVKRLLRGFVKARYMSHFLSRQRSCNWSLCYDRCGWKTWKPGAAGKVSARWSHSIQGWLSR